VEIMIFGLLLKIRTHKVMNGRRREHDLRIESSVNES
jgi:hypothetical protein